MGGYGGARLDPLLSSPVRLAIMAILMKMKQAGFQTLMEGTETTQGNMSQQLKKLSEEGYIKIEKTYKDNYPHMVCEITNKGKKAFEKYVEEMRRYLNL
jgi:DNA-binding MarR family transcriptional regulator